MVKMNVEYTGELHCKIAHGPSGALIETDAPKDNLGRGESFSPTDLVGAALASCVITTMAIVAKRDGIAFEGATATVEKEMVTQPTRRIGSLKVQVIASQKGLSKEQIEKLERVAHHCPVHKSLHPDVQMPIEIIWK